MKLLLDGLPRDTLVLAICFDDHCVDSDRNAVAVAWAMATEVLLADIGRLSWSSRFKGGAAGAPVPDSTA